MFSRINSISSKTRFVIIIAGLVTGSALISALIMFFVIQPINSEAGEINLMKQELAALEAKRTQIKNIESNIENSANDFKRIDGTIISVSNPLHFFESLYSIASSSNVAINLTLLGQTAGPKQAKSGEQPGFKMSVKAAISGTPADIYKFLSLLESLPSITEIKSFSVSGAASPLSPMQMDLEISVLSKN